MQKIKQEIIKKINKKYGNDLLDIADFSYPPDPQMGDLALPCFKLSKEFGKNPAELAEQMVSDFSGKIDLVQSLVSAGPYLNFFLNKEKIIEDFYARIKKYPNNFLVTKSAEKKRIMVEFSNVNTHKEYHVGHLRNLSFGDSVCRLLRANGHDVVPVSYINDFGIHVARTIWAYNEFFKSNLIPKNKGAFLGEVYKKASQELKTNEVGKTMSAFIMKKIETRQGPEYELWKRTREWSIEQFASIYEEMNIDIEHTFYESEFIEKGLGEVQELEKKGILQKSQGAIIADLEKYDLGVLVVIRADGTALYPVADIPLARHKIKEYKLDQSIYVVDNRQKLYFAQLFKLLELMGYKEEMLHLDYDFVTLPGGAMSSRDGNTVTYEELRAEAFKRAYLETKKRHNDWPEFRIKEVSEKIIFGAMKFEMIKVGSDQVITFDLDQALRFDGYTAAYLQYSYARISSILRKAEDITGKNIDFSALEEEREKSLIIKMAKYPETLKKAGQNHNPADLARYLFELAQSFNDYYHSIPILKSENKMQPRLALVYAVAQTIKNGLNLLGVEVMEEM